MAMDFAVIVHVRHQFGRDDIDIGVYAGRERSWTFDCPDVSAAAHAILLFQVASVDTAHSLSVNGFNVAGGIPAGENFLVSTAVAFTGAASLPQHAHSLPDGGSTGITGNPPTIEQGHAHVVPFGSGWSGRVMIVPAGVLLPQGNTLTVTTTTGEMFLLDNVVILYRTKPSNGTGLPTSRI
jgi:hypothetical protein